MIHLHFHRDKRVTTLAGYDFPGLMGRWNAAAAQPLDKAGITALLESEGEPEHAETWASPDGFGARLH